jgi:hypothetical protein
VAIAEVGADLDDEIDVADVDTELERCRGDQRAQLAGLEPRLGLEPALAGQAAVMARDVARAECVGEPGGHALGELARVHEHERRAVLANQVAHASRDALPRLV